MLGERIVPAPYDRLTEGFERRFAEKRWLELSPASGRVLEIGAGTGWSFRHYPEGVTEVVALEPDDGMRARGERRAAESGRPVRLVRGSAEDLPFEDDSFDWVVSMVVLCTVADPERAFAEIRRVLRLGGSLLFAEHVRSESPRLARWQDRLERPWGALARGCHPNRDGRGPSGGRLRREGDGAWRPPARASDRHAVRDRPRRAGLMTDC
jgi:ubiquinone/menaquinone biosynthesis C-methylase UbiE